MRCIVCSKNDWENVDEFRELPKHEGKAVGMSLCKSCGFISYPSKYKTEEEIKEYYRKEYRGGPPSYGNIITGARKLSYHANFLKEVILKWRDEDVKPVIGEVGAAIGMVGNWFKNNVRNCEYHGVELTKTFVNTAFHEFGIELKENLDLSKKYDLIMSYKVAEHQLDVDLRIREYAEALNEGGYLYISVPTWFNHLENSGVGGFDLEYYYHPDHINTWTRVHFEEILRKCGLKIVKTDRLVYGDSYLCKRDDSEMEKEQKLEDPDQIRGALKRVKEAFVFMKTQKAEQALERWGNFPAAWVCYYEQNRQKFHDKYKGNGAQIAEILHEEMTKACGPTLHAEHLKADILVRYGQYVPAIETLEGILETKPSDTRALFALSQCFRSIAEGEKDSVKKARFLMTARDICRRIASIDEQMKPEALNWALRDDSQISADVAKQVMQESKETEPPQMAAH